MALMANWISDILRTWSESNYCCACYEFNYYRFTFFVWEPRQMLSSYSFVFWRGLIWWSRSFSIFGEVNVVEIYKFFNIELIVLKTFEDWLKERREVLDKRHSSDYFFQGHLFVLKVFGVETFVEFVNLTSFSTFKECHQLCSKLKIYKYFRIAII